MRLFGNEQGEIDRCGTDERRRRIGKRIQSDGRKRWSGAQLAESAIIAVEAFRRLSALVRCMAFTGFRSVMLRWLMLAKRHGDRGKALQA